MTKVQAELASLALYTRSYLTTLKYGKDFETASKMVEQGWFEAANHADRDFAGFYLTAKAVEWLARPKNLHLSPTIPKPPTKKQQTNKPVNLKRKA